MLTQFQGHQNSFISGHVIKTQVIHGQSYPYPRPEIPGAWFRAGHREGTVKKLQLNLQNNDKPIHRQS